ncbi:MAG: glutamate racemase [Alphaproteobacteria bacterium]
MPSVLVFDSGLGGLTVRQEILALMPEVTCHYMMDTARFPYGLQPADRLIEAIPQILLNAVEAERPDAVVIACNTASTLALQHVRAVLDIPVIGTVPAVKPAAAIAGNRPIAVLGTPLTVKSAYLDQLVSDHAQGIEVLRHGSAELVTMAEQYFLTGNRPDPAALGKALGPLIDRPDLAAIVLSCTHFPLLKEDIAELLPDGVQLVDSGAAIARQVQRVISEAPTDSIAQPQAIATAPVCESMRQALQHHCSFENVRVML